MKALERRFGAHAVDIDSMKGWCRFALLQPRNLSFEELHQAMESANYTTRNIRLEVEAEVLRKEGDRFVLRIQGSDQELLVEGNDLSPAFEGYVLVTADVDPDLDIVSVLRARPGSLPPTASESTDK